MLHKRWLAAVTLACSATALVAPRPALQLRIAATTSQEPPPTPTLAAESSFPASAWPSVALKGGCVQCDRGRRPAGGPVVLGGAGRRQSRRRHAPWRRGWLGGCGGCTAWCIRVDAWDGARPARGLASCIAGGHSRRAGPRAGRRLGLGGSAGGLPQRAWCGSTDVAGFQPLFSVRGGSLPLWHSHAFRPRSRSLLRKGTPSLAVGSVLGLDGMAANPLPLRADCSAPDAARPGPP